MYWCYWSMSHLLSYKTIHICLLTTCTYRNILLMVLLLKNLCYFFAVVLDGGEVFFFFFFTPPSSWLLRKKKMYIYAYHSKWCVLLMSEKHATNHQLFPGVDYWWFLVNVDQTPCYSCPVPHPLSHFLSVYCLDSPSSDQLLRTYSLSSCPPY